MFIASVQILAQLAASLTGPGVSKELATARAAQISNVRYALNLDVTRRDTAYGSARIRFARRGGGDVILDFRGPTLVKPDGVEWNGAHVRVPEQALGTGGEGVLTFDFTALVAPAGASVIRVRDAADQRDYLYTLLVPADANQLFPCFDQPDLKARTTLSLVVPNGWSAVSNGALADSAAGERATTFRFAESRPISTYLIGFAAGPWTRITRSASGRAITLYVRASRARWRGAPSRCTSGARAFRSSAPTPTASSR